MSPSATMWASFHESRTTLAAEAVPARQNIANNETAKTLSFISPRWLTGGILSTRQRSVQAWTVDPVISQAKMRCASLDGSRYGVGARVALGVRRRQRGRSSSLTTIFGDFAEAFLAFFLRNFVF